MFFNETIKHLESWKHLNSCGSVLFKSKDISSTNLVQFSSILAWFKITGGWLLKLRSNYTNLTYRLLFQPFVCLRSILLLWGPNERSTYFWPWHLNPSMPPTLLTWEHKLQLRVSVFRDQISKDTSLNMCSVFSPRFDKFLLIITQNKSANSAFIIGALFLCKETQCTRIRKMLLDDFQSCD